MTVDWDRIERWKGLLLENETGEIESVFHSDGARGPSIKWRPTVDDLQPKVLKFALDHWDRAVVSLGAPRIRLVDPVLLAPTLGYLLLVDVVDDGRDFAYRLFGTIAGTVSGFDMTGRKLSDHPASTYIREFSMALYRAAMLRREPVWSHYGPAMAVSTAAWERVVLPLVDDSDKVCRFLVATVPTGLDGQPLRR